MRISLLMFARATLLLSLACHDAATSTTPPPTSDLPAGTLLVWWDDTLATVTTAGARLTVLMTGSTSLSISPEWSPDGSKAVIYEGDPAIDARISTLDMSGTRTLVVGPSDSLHAASFPRFTRDGSWIYFSGNSGSGYVTYRVKPDGTQLEQIGPTVGEGGSLRPDVSPDGQTEVFESADSTIGVMDIATHAIRSFGVPGFFPRYSPDGTQIAYLAGQTGGERVLNVMNADGTNPHQVSPPSFTYEDFAAVDWSTDGKWLVAASHYSTVDLVRLSDGLRLPLQFHALQVAWQP